MLKISENKLTQKAVTLRLEGRIVGPWVEELKQTCKSHARTKLSLDLADVSSVDNEAIALLADLRSRGADLLNLTPFVAEQLKSAAETSR